MGWKLPCLIYTPQPCSGPGSAPLSSGASCWLLWAQGLCELHLNIKCVCGAWRSWSGGKATTATATPSFATISIYREHGCPPPRCRESLETVLSVHASLREVVKSPLHHCRRAQSICLSPGLSHIGPSTVQCPHANFTPGVLLPPPGHENRQPPRHSDLKLPDMACSALLLRTLWMAGSRSFR